MNQCDGCRAGIPIDENGNHRMGAFAYPDLLGCQRSKYEAPQDPGLVRSLVDALARSLKARPKRRRLK